MREAEGLSSFFLLLSTYTKLIVYFIIRLIGRLKPGLHKQSLPSETEEIQRAQAGFVCVDAVSTARSSLSVVK